MSNRIRAVLNRQRSHFPNVRASMLISLVVWTEFMSGCAGSTPSSAPQSQKSQESVDIPTPKQGLTKVREQPEQRFVPATLAELPATIQSHLNYGALELFSADILPFGYVPDLYTPVPPARASDAKVRVFAASDKNENDLVEVTWQHRGIPLRWVQRINISVVEFPLEPFQSESAGKACQKVREFLGEVIRLRGESDYNKLRPYEIQLPWPESLTDGMEFTSNPHKDFQSLSRWQDRVDVVIEQGRLKLITYHLNSRAMYFLDGSEFFPEDFRKIILERMRAEKPAAEQP